MAATTKGDSTAHPTGRHPAHVYGTVKVGHAVNVITTMGTGNSN